MGETVKTIIKAIPAILVGVICAGIAGASGCETSKKLILEKGGDALCSEKRKK